MKNDPRIRIVALTGMLGSGFDEESLTTAIGSNPDVIGCDAGSTDNGPYFLGSGATHASDDAVARDLRLAVDASLSLGIPLIVGSAGTAGAAPHLERVIGIVRVICQKMKVTPRVAVIRSDISVDHLRELKEEGRLLPLGDRPPFPSDVSSNARFVAMMGAEPIIAALEAGADIILAGRCSDAAIFAAYPLMAGLPPGIAWHAGKILECGAGAAESRLHPDVLVADLYPDRFVVEPPNPLMRCTPQSVAAHALYENADPFLMKEPGGVLDLSSCSYRAETDRAVEVTGSRWLPSSDYTVRIEGADLVGYRTISIGGIRDPKVTREIGQFIEGIEKTVGEKVAQSLDIQDHSYEFRVIAYGSELMAVSAKVRDPICLVMDAIAPTQRTASAIASIAWHSALHLPVAGWSGLLSNIAFPFSPPAIEAGPVFEFCINSIALLESNTELFPSQFLDF